MGRRWTEVPTPTWPCPLGPAGTPFVALFDLQGAGPSSDACALSSSHSLCLAQVISLATSLPT